MTDGLIKNKHFYLQLRRIILITIFLSLFIISSCSGGSDESDKSKGTTEVTTTVIPIPTTLPSPAASDISPLDFPQINVENASLLDEIASIEVQATTLAFSADGLVLALGTVKDGVILYDIGTLAEIRRLPASALITGLSFSPDGTTLAVVTNSNSENGNSVITIMMYDATSWSQLATVNLQMESATDFNQESAEIFTGVLQITTDHRIIFTNGHESRLKNSHLFVFSLQGTNPEILQQIQVPKNDSCWGAELLPDGNTIFAGDRFYDLGTGNIVNQLQFEQGRATTGAVSHDGSMIAYASLGTYQVHVDLLPALDRKINLDGLRGKVLAVDFSADSSLIAASSRGQELFIWNADNGELLAKLIGTTGTAFSPKGNLLASIQIDNGNPQHKVWRVLVYGLAKLGVTVTENIIEATSTNEAEIPQNDTEVAISESAVVIPTSSVEQPTVAATSKQVSSAWDSYQAWIACPNAPVSYLHPGMDAYVIYGTGANRLRQKPGINAAVIDLLPEGKVVHIYDGPACDNDWVWWFVGNGWTAEVGDAYWLLPCQIGVSCP